MNSALIALYLSVSTVFSLPEGLLSSICYVESKHTITAMHHSDGGSPSIGACQIKYDTAKLIGYRGAAKDLQLPAVNVYYAGAYLRRNLDRYDGDIRKAVAAYNAGSHLVNAKGLTVNRKYVSKVLNAWAENR